MPAPVRESSLPLRSVTPESWARTLARETGALLAD